jgi:hypothetical protein
VQSAEVVVIGTRAVDKATLLPVLRKEQVVVDFVNLEKSRRPDEHGAYQGICW